MAPFGERDVARLLGDAGIVRHRGKIEAAIANAKAAPAMHADGESLGELIWSFAPGGRRRAPRSLEDLPAVTPESTALSKELKKRGFRFVGPTTAYATMQACGVVNDHLAGCWVRRGGGGRAPRVPAGAHDDGTEERDLPDFFAIDQELRTTLQCP